MRPISLEKALPVAAVPIGLTWGHADLLPLSVIFPVLWCHSTRRWTGALTAAAYYLAASRGLVPGAATFYDRSYFTGLVIWLVPALLHAVLYFCCWRPTLAGRILVLPLILLLTAVPPLGVVGWAHPLTAAGVLLPGFGWLGLALTLLVMLAVSTKPVQTLPFLLLLAVVARFIEPAVVPPASWAGVDTGFKQRPEGAAGYIDDYRRQLHLMAQVQTSAAATVVLPESSVGDWNDHARRLWTPVQEKLGHRRILMGAILQPAACRRENVLVRIDSRGDRVVYRQRMPVPLGMWRPWAEKGFIAHWFQNPVFDLDDRPMAALICYEQFLVWPVLHSMLHQPVLLIGIANDWWAVETSLPAIQQSALAAWGRLFGVPVITATNMERTS